jgi:hypothetical protein
MWRGAHTEGVKPFYRVAAGFLGADYLAGLIGLGVAHSVVSSRNCNGDFACAISGAGDLVEALFVLVIVSLFAVALLSVAASLLAPHGRRSIAFAVHLPLLLGTLFVTGYIASHHLGALYFAPVLASAATAAFAAHQRTAATPARQPS